MAPILKLFASILFLGVIALPIVSATDQAVDLTGKYDFVCVCMRGNASTWIIDTSTDQPVRIINHKYNSLGYEKTAVPMYCDYYEVEDGNKKYLSVGDRANRVVYILDVDNDFEVVGSLDVEEGIFHHWVSVEANQIWVVCDGLIPGVTAPLRDSNVSTWVFDATTFELLTIVPFPEDLYPLVKDTGATLHDVAVSPSGDFAIVTTTGFTGLNDFALKYSTETFEETGRAAVGKSPHVTYLNESLPLYIISQNSLLDSISLIDPKTMEVQSSIPGLQGAHMMVGAGADGKTYYVTNLPAGGVDGLFAFDSALGQVDYSAVTDTVYSVPHNVALSGNRKKLYLTHSGPNVEVTVWDVSNLFNPRPTFLKAIICELNPYGIENFQTTVKIGDASRDQSAGGAVGVSWLVVVVGVVVGWVVGRD